MEKFCIYNMKLAGFLMMNQCRLYRIEHDLKNKGRDVYIFKKTPHLENLIEIYKKSKGENK